jgi:hypothetical protein
MAKNHFWPSHVPSLLPLDRRTGVSVLDVLFIPRLDYRRLTRTQFVLHEEHPMGRKPAIIADVQRTSCSGKRGYQANKMDLEQLRRCMMGAGLLLVK